jgi:hypothetical protein
VKKAPQSVACGTTHARKGRDGVAAGHRAALLSAGSGAVERIRRLPDGYQRVAQLLSRDAFTVDGLRAFVIRCNVEDLAKFEHSLRA